MKYRKLGHTGLEVSVLGFGASSLGEYYGKVDDHDGIRTFHVALEHGINLIDTAPFYGNTRSESLLGRALREIPRDRYLLATKVGRYGELNSIFDFSAGRVIQSVDESLSRLGVDYVDFIQIHDIEFASIEQIITETIPALRNIQASGKARYIGITCLPLRLFPAVLDRVKVDQIQSYCHYCLNDTSLADHLPYLNAQGVAVFNSAPLAMRLLSNAGPAHWHPAPMQLKAKCAEAAEFCRARGQDIGKLALQFSVANPEIHTHIIGTARPERILQNIREIEEPIDDELLAEVLKILQPVHNLTWPSGRSENHP